MNSNRLPILAALLTLAVVATAQVPPDEAGVDVGKVTFEQRENGMVEITRNTDGSVAERVLTPHEADEHLKREGVGNVAAGPELVHGQAYPQPRRMAPGQSGTLKVMAALGGSCVVLPGGQIKLQLQPVDGLAFGTPVLQAAAKGTLEGVFQGKPVYDDYVLFDVPLQVSATVEAPKNIYLAGNLDLELHNGKTGVRMGVFSVKVGGRVPVGKPLPASNLAVPGRSHPGKRTAARSAPGGATQGTPGVPPKPNPRTGSTGDAQPTATTTKGEGVMAKAGTDRRQHPTGSEVDPEVDPALRDTQGGDGSSWLVYVFGGVIAAILALVLLSRRK